MDSILGIIPARAGSKRLPGKNMKLLKGISLLERTIAQAKKALPVSVVTSDDMQMLKVAVENGVKGLLRPFDLSTGTASSADVVRHVLGIYPGFLWFCLLQVTSPLRTVEDIRNCIDIADQTGRPVVSVYNGKSNGAIYINNVLSFSGDFLDNAVLYEMPEERSIDIDTIFDFKRSEALL